MSNLFEKKSLTKTITSLPNSAGVYHYYDKNHRLLYIGKAKDLAKRVRSYFRLTPTLHANPRLNARVKHMVELTLFLEYIIVESEHDALILENSLIKQLKPRYNILLRDDKTYPYIYYDKSELYPRLEITRKLLPSSKIEYFGPYPQGARDTLKALYELFPLVQKKSCLKGGKKCLFFQIRKCLAPCEERVTPQEYGEILKDAIKGIKNKKTLLKKLYERMQKLAEDERFEEAAELRNRYRNIEKSILFSDMDTASKSNLDLFAIAHDERRAVVVMLFIRDGKIVSSSNSTFVTQHGFDEDEAYKQAILEFYTNKAALTTKTIITAHEFEDRAILTSYLSKLYEHKIELNVPKKGEKRRLAILALKNAEEFLKQTNNQSNESYKQMVKLKELASLQNIPERIEIFDNSHIQGSSPVGAMVVYQSASFSRRAYRHYTLEGRDEYTQMRELLSRRISDFSTNPPPDLWLIDGGATLLKLAKSLLKESNITLDVIAISKEKVDNKTRRSKTKANDTLYTQNDTLLLNPSNRELQWVQKMRDEAHRFAITFHKKSKLAKDKQSRLLQTKGIGPAKVKKLLNFFGTYEAIYKATYPELRQLLSEKETQSILSLGNL